jgi:hypothetical protein
MVRWQACTKHVWHKTYVGRLVGAHEEKAHCRDLDADGKTILRLNLKQNMRVRSEFN